MRRPHPTSGAPFGEPLPIRNHELQTDVQAQSHEASTQPRTLFEIAEETRSVGERLYIHNPNDTSHQRAIHKSYARSDRRARNSEVEDALHNIVRTTAGLYLDSSRDAAAATEIESFLMLRVGGDETKRQDLAITWRENIFSLLGLHDSFNQAAIQVLPKLEQFVSAGPEAQLQLLDFIGPRHEQAVAGGDDERALLTSSLAVVAIYSEMTTDLATTVTNAQQALLDGRLDSALCTALFRQPATIALKPQAQSRIKKLGNLVTLTNPGLAPEQVIERISNPEALRHWPSEARVELATYKAQVAGPVEMELNAARKLIREEVMLPRRTVAEADDAINQARETLLRKNRMPQTLSKSAMMQERADEKRARRSRNADVVKESSIVSPEAMRQNRLLYLSPGGERIPSEDSKFEAFLTEYIQKHRGEPGLRQDVTEALKFLQTIDLSVGIIMGIKKYGNTLTRAGQAYDFYGFKPSDVAGLSMVSRSGKKLRIMFTFIDKESVALLDVLDRDEVIVWERNHKINSTAGR